jgi:hypothetical protein
MELNQAVAVVTASTSAGRSKLINLFLGTSLAPLRTLAEEFYIVLWCECFD